MQTGISPLIAQKIEPSQGLTSELVEKIPKTSSELPSPVSQEAGLPSLSTASQSLPNIVSPF